eukprot:scaffold108706_cov19-Prasinocladus_malaysianus.AAC.1
MQWKDRTEATSSTTGMMHTRLIVSERMLASPAAAVFEAGLRCCGDVRAFADNIAGRRTPLEP